MRFTSSDPLRKFEKSIYRYAFDQSESDIQASGSAIEGAVFPDLAVTPDFRTRYKHRFGNDIQISFTANAYDIAILVATHFGKNRAYLLSNLEIMSRLRESEIVFESHRKLQYERDPIFGEAFVSPLVIRKVMNGQIREVLVAFE